MRAAIAPYSNIFTVINPLFNSLLKYTLNQNLSLQLWERHCRVRLHEGLASSSILYANAVILKNDTEVSIELSHKEKLLNNTDEDMTMMQLRVGLLLWSRDHCSCWPVSTHPHILSYKQSQKVTLFLPKRVLNIWKYSWWESENEGWTWRLTELYDNCKTGILFERVS